MHWTIHMIGTPHSHGIHGMSSYVGLIYDDEQNAWFRAKVRGRITKDTVGIGIGSVVAADDLLPAH